MPCADGRRQNEALVCGMFWKRKHGALRGLTVLQALTEGHDAGALDRVVELARDLVDERGPTLCQQIHADFDRNLRRMREIL
jgi:hypothetical protein